MWMNRFLNLQSKLAHSVQIIMEKQCYPIIVNGYMTNTVNVSYGVTAKSKRKTMRINLSFYITNLK